MGSTALLLTLLAMPPPPEALVKPGGGVVNVKVRRIGQLEIIDTAAPPPAIALRGKHRLLAVLIEANDSPWPKSGFDRSRFQEMLFAKGTASLREYYRENSYGAFEVTGEVIGPLKVDVNLSDFTYQPGSASDAIHDLVSGIFRAALERVEPSKFDTHDLRGRPGSDGFIDHFVIVYAERSGQPMGFQPIWPHRGTIDVDGGKAKLASYLILNHGAPLGVYTHEFGHDLGLPDLYDRDNTSHGVGAWCLMASGSWGGGGERPYHLSAWAKARLGWITPTIVSKSASGIRVPSASEKPFALKIPIGAVDSTEYFLLENRRRVGFDSLLPTDGIVMWHIDELVGHNDDEKRKMVDVAEATKVQDLDFIEQGRFPEYAPDVFSASGQAVFDDATNPSARSNGGEPTQIRVRVTTAPGREMRVDVERPEIWNPGGVPFVMERDGWQYGRFSTVPTGVGSEALVSLEATPGGFLVFGAEVFVSGAPNARGRATVRLYSDDSGKPGKILIEKAAALETGAEGFAWVKVRLATEKGGEGLASLSAVKLASAQTVWVGVTNDEGNLYASLNPASISKTARFRQNSKAKLSTEFNFSTGREAVMDYVIRLQGFGYVDGSAFPEPRAGEDDPVVVAMRVADRDLDGGRKEQALASYERLLPQMEQDARKYEAWIPTLVNSIGVAAYELGRFELARDRFQQSLLRAQAVRDAPSEADVLENLCETHFASKAFSEARNACDRGRIVNEKLGRPDRLVENHYWFARSVASLEHPDQTVVSSALDKALASAKKAFEKLPSELREWEERIQKARAGEAKEPPKPKERPDEKGPRHKTKTTDLLQFLMEDMEDVSEPADVK
ncbi:MAG: M6 family metalloprotease domain-containing protein [Deltaproteobacteria bacterium]|nr:M6 family metalloprotease domain-containing protein [Deltaproteobacteria bacterium]